MAPRKATSDELLHILSVHAHDIYALVGTNVGSLGIPASGEKGLRIHASLKPPAKPRTFEATYMHHGEPLLVTIEVTDDYRDVVPL
jgi:hypothetical protein